MIFPFKFFVDLAGKNKQQTNLKFSFYWGWISLTTVTLNVFHINISIVFLQLILFLSFIYIFLMGIYYFLDIIMWSFYTLKIVTIVYSIYCDVYILFLNQNFASFCFKSTYSFVFLKITPFLKKLILRNICFFTETFWEIYSNCCIRYLTYLLFCLCLLFLDNVLLFILCVPVFGTMIGVLIPFIFHGDLECRHPIFLLFLWLLLSFLKSYVNLYFKNIKVMNETKPLTLIVILDIWKVFYLVTSSIHCKPLLI